MQIEPIEETINLIISKYSASANESLDGFVCDVEHYFGQIPKEIKKTSDANCLLTITVKPDQTFEKLQDVHSWLESVWTKFAYRHYQAYSCESYLETVALRFVTLGKIQSSFVTGIILARAANHEALVEYYNREFARFAPLNPLPSRWQRSPGSDQT